MPSRIILPRFSPNSATPPPPVISLRAAFLLLRAPRIQAPLRQEMCRCPEVSRAAQLGGDIAEGISRRGYRVSTLLLAHFKETRPANLAASRTAGLLTEAEPGGGSLRSPASRKQNPGYHRPRRQGRGRGAETRGRFTGSAAALARTCGPAAASPRGPGTRAAY